MYYTFEEAQTLKKETLAYLHVEENDHLLTITLNRPEKKNAMNQVFMRELAFALAYARGNNDIWAVAIKANGDIFSAGADLKAFAGINTDDKQSTVPDKDEQVKLGDEFATLYKPCIAFVHAPVYAGGFMILGGCTHVLATLNATFALPEVKRGLWPFQVMESLMQIVPTRKLLDLCMRGNKINTNTAYDLGIVTQIVENEKELEEKGNALIAEIKENSPTAIRSGLKAFYELQTHQKNQRHQYLFKQLQELINSEDAKEGLMAFAQKRKPKWTGK